MKEIKVYVVDVQNFSFDTFAIHWTDEKFISEAEIQGSVYSLKKFQNAFIFINGVV